MKKLLSILSLMLCLMVGMTACSNNDEPQGDEQEIVTDKPISLPKICFTPAQKAVAEKSMNFEMDFCNTVDSYLTEMGKDNYAVCPVGVYFNLAMLANGAAGETQEEILNTLGFAADDIETSNEICKMLMTSLNVNDSFSKIAMVNSLWHLQNIVAHDSYKALIADVFDAKTFQVSNQNFVTEFNKWCSEKTYGKINEMLDPKGHQPFFLVSNVFYFDCKWDTPFDKLPGKLTFKNIDETKSEVEGMTKDLGAWILRNDAVDICFIPYGNEETIFGVLVPKNSDSYNDIQTEFSEWMKADPFDERFQYVNITMPMFSMETSVDLLNVIPKMGILKLFNKDECNLSNMFTAKHYINLMQQSNTLEVTENGSVAASVTISGEMYTSPGAPHIQIKVDRPFYFMVMEKGSKSILLSGRVNKL